MPDPNDKSGSGGQPPNQITTPTAQHQETASRISDDLGSVLGTNPSLDDIIPAQERPAASDQEYFNPSDFQEKTNRIFFNKPGFEPSKKFLTKLMEKMQKKHPDANVVLRGEDKD